MKIILSPAKTQQFSDGYTKSTTTPVFQKEATKLLKILRKKTVEELIALYKINEKHAIKLFEAYQSPPQSQQAFDTYTGIVFQSMHLTSWDEQMRERANKQTFILDALYGALKPSDGITAYRLDMSHGKILTDETLKHFWKKRFAVLFKDEPLIINLASKEFSSLVPQEHMVTIDFLDWRDNQYKAVNTYVKMARGAFYEVIIKEKIKTKVALRNIVINDYQYNQAESTSQRFVYTKKDMNVEK